MKILAIENEISGVDWSGSSNLLIQEAQYIFDLTQRNIIKEIYFNEENCAVIIIECADIESANLFLSDLPLVKAGLIKFNIMELRPYTGFDRLS